MNANLQDWVFFNFLFWVQDILLHCKIESSGQITYSILIKVFFFFLMWMHEVCHHIILEKKKLKKDLKKQQKEMMVTDSQLSI